MNVSLTSELENLIQEKVNSGNYNSASEVVREALRLLKDHEQFRELRREEVRREVMKGVEQVRNGEGKTYNSAAELADTIISRAKKNRESK